MIVEFAGLPGSGKSTLAAGLLDAARSRGLDASPLSSAPPRRTAAGWLLPLRRAACLVRYPSLTSTMVTGLARSQRDLSERWFTFRHVVVTAHAMHATAKHAPPGALVVASEGIAQRAFMVFVDAGGAASPDTVARFVSNSPSADVVVLLHVDPSAAIDRIVRRGHGPLSLRFAGLPRDELEARLADGQRMLLDTLEAIAALPADQRPFLPVVLDGRDLGAALDQLCRLMLPRTDGPGTSRDDDTARQAR